MSESSGPSGDDVMNAESVADIAPAVVEEVAEVPEPGPEVAEPEPEPEHEVAEVEAPSTQEVVQNVQEMLSSTDTSGSVNELENRVKVLEGLFASKFFWSLLCNRRACEIVEALWMVLEESSVDALENRVKVLEERSVDALYA